VTGVDEVDADRPVLKIAVFSDGRLTVDGNAASIHSLRESLRELSERRGWFGITVNQGKR
jgi:hypothetical protein